jgi:threonine dehydratase
MLLRAVRAPSRAELEAAERVVARQLAPTPLVPFASAGRNAWLKLETLQPTGSFKVRGAAAALAASAGDGELVTASAGNHALAVAWAAARLGRSATVVVPETASEAKIAGLRASGVRLVLHGDTYEAAERHALELGGQFVSPYNDPHVIAGQRTLGVEVGRQLAGPVTVACPVGGGGLLAGVALWASEHPEARVVGVEAAACPAVSAAVAAGRVVEVEARPTLADGMAGQIEPGSVTVDLAREHVDLWVTVDEDELAHGLRVLALDEGLVVEGAGAAAAAAVLAGKVGDDRPGASVVAIASGRNIAGAELAAVLAG